MSVLDVGCGTGDDVRAIAEIVGDGGAVRGVDSSAAMIAEAQKRGVPPNVEFLRADARRLPFPAATYDAIRAERLFQHLSDAQAAAAELRRVSREGARAFVIDPDWDSLIVGGTEPELTRRITRALSERLTNPWAGRNARHLLRRAGFRSVVSSPISASPALAPAYDLFLSSAIDAAIEAKLVSTEEAARWLEALTDAERRGEFFCAVMSVATLATA